MKIDPTTVVVFGIVFLYIAIRRLAGDYVETLPGWPLVAWWILANVLDVHSTLRFTRYTGHEGEANEIARGAMNRYGTLRGLLIIKLSIGTVVTIAIISLADNAFTLSCSIIFTLVAAWNYLFTFAMWRKTNEDP